VQQRTALPCDQPVGNDLVRAAGSLYRAGMAQMTWRTLDELLERVRRQARDRGRSLNEWVTAVLSAAADPSLTGDDAQRVRERLAAAGLLDTPQSPSRVPRRPDDAELARARAAAGQGTPLSALVGDGRR